MTLLPLEPDAQLSEALTGSRGAASTGHPLATQAALTIVEQGGSAVDAAIAAQAVICVVMPQAAGLGGDMMALVHDRGSVVAVNGTGRSARRSPPQWASDGGSSVTVPGIVHSWDRMREQWGILEMGQILQPAVTLARKGYRCDSGLIGAMRAQKDRLERYDGGAWALLGLTTDSLWVQPELATMLDDISRSGAAAFYREGAADAIVRAIQRHGGTLSADDLLAHDTEISEPAFTAWSGGTLFVQPPSSQGVLLAAAARWLERHPEVASHDLEHVLVEATEAVFQFRDDVNADPNLLERELSVDQFESQQRGGPRAYLHTAGVAVADASGLVVSSLVSVFDDFGSGVYVPELGFTLNNRAAGFTSGNNAPQPNAKPVHTLAPAMLITAEEVLALATPGADGQVQTLLQVLSRMRLQKATLSEAIAALRWRSESGDLLIEEGHPQIEELRKRGHRVSIRAAGDDIFGAAVAAGTRDAGPFAASDWRRRVTTGVT